MLGAGLLRFFTNLKELVENHKPSSLFLLEPRVLSVKGRHILPHLYFTNLLAIEARGFSGSIWCFWDASRIQISVFAANAQSLTVGVMQGDCVK